MLDWPIADVNHQVGYADILLTRLGIKYVIVEAKRPGALAWNRRAIDEALAQARRYAAEQKVQCVAVCDGVMFYAADVRHGGLRDRVFCDLQNPSPAPGLWWLSIDGIYRPCTSAADLAFQLVPTATMPADACDGDGDGAQLIHHKYKLPARCFGYVGDASDPHTWHLPYLNADGAVDTRRLPKAVQAILSNYRGAHVTTIPEQAIPDVLVRLARAAAGLGKLPPQTAQPAPAYAQLIAALTQLGRLSDIDTWMTEAGAGAATSTI
ncbi:MAG TPA: hypothetical protein VE127_08235 [Solirubrobacteraceae bacterium]|nr:hypothetical protein [Solirubrobacteraceae bacterium]